MHIVVIHTPYEHTWIPRYKTHTHTRTRTRKRNTHTHPHGVPSPCDQKVVTDLTHTEEVYFYFISDTGLVWSGLLLLPRYPISDHIPRLYRPSLDILWIGHPSAAQFTVGSCHITQQQHPHNPSRWRLSSTLPRSRLWIISVRLKRRHRITPSPSKVPFLPNPRT